MCFCLFSSCTSEKSLSIARPIFEKKIELGSNHWEPVSSFDVTSQDLLRIPINSDSSWLRSSQNQIDAPVTPMSSSEVTSQDLLRTPINSDSSWLRSSQNEIDAPVTPMSSSQKTLFSNVTVSRRVRRVPVWSQQRRGASCTAEIPWHRQGIWHTTKVSLTLSERRWGWQMYRRLATTTMLLLLP